jgi:hypothetical protein
VVFDVAPVFEDAVVAPRRDAPFLLRKNGFGRPDRWPVLDETQDKECSLMKKLKRSSWYSWILSLALLLAPLLLICGESGRRSVAHAAGGNSGAAALKNTAVLAALQANSDPSVAGRWEPQENGTFVDTSWPIPPIHINLLPNGKLLFWARDKSSDGLGFDIQDFTTAHVWDPFYRTFTGANNGRTNLFCSGHSFLPDGRLLVTGGHNILTTNRTAEGMGSIHTNIYDYKTGSWTAGPDMNNGRWYPYNVTLANGETLVVSGSYLTTTASGAQTTAQNRVAQILDAQGNFRNVIDPRGFSISDIQNYPLLHSMPDGRVLVAAARTQQQSVILTPSSVDGEGAWVRGPFLTSQHDQATSVQYQQDKVLIIGGRFNTQATTTSEIFDLNATPTLRTTQPMNFPRMHHTSTLLPDGKVLVTGGTSCPGTNELNCGPNGSYGGAANNPELWNPADETWTVMTPHQEARVYHSSAILLPDGRVLVGGGGLPGATGEYPAGNDVARRLSQHKSAEYFYPPYFYLPGGGLAPRPVITSAPKELTYGQNFSVGVGTVTAQDVESAVLVRLGAVTHGFNQDQRRVPLTVTSRAADGRSLNLNAPAGGTQAPPGYYMLFLLKRNGANLTPSVAKIVRVNKVSTPSVIQALSSRSETRNLPVSATAGTNWTASVTAGSSFISINAPTGTATGNGTLTYSVTANTTGARRNGKITISVPGQPAFNQVINVYQGKQFDDVPADWSEDTPGKLNALGITSGCSANSFCTNNPITRAELAVQLVRAALDVDAVPPATNKVTFPNDVPLSHWAHAYIEDLYKRGLTGGCAPGSFCPGNNVSRAELAVFLVRALNIDPPATTKQTFQDVPTNHWAHRFIEEAVARGLMVGCGVGGSDSTIPGESTTIHFFCPGDAVSRAEVAGSLLKTHGY